MSEDSSPQQSDQSTGAADAASTAGEDIHEQARDLAGSGKIRLRIDETDVPTRYANSFRTNVTPEDVIIDFGMNTVTKANRSEKGVEAEILFKIDEKRVINYYTAKRLAMTLSRLVRVYEDRFGELKLNVTEREKNK
jgi:uncharacterized protein DUF3467